MSKTVIVARLTLAGMLGVTGSAAAQVAGGTTTVGVGAATAKLRDSIDSARG
jgi:hypothetical protein